VKLEFEGTVGAEGFTSVQPEKAGWRYGFLASLDDSSREYGEIYADSKGTGEFVVPENTKHLWLVVMGAPTEHWVRQGRWGRRRGGNDGSGDEQWPYRFRLEGTTPDKSTID
jgi:hypothetical protein